MTRILVLYGTTDGHAAKVARAVAEPLRTHGLVTDVATPAARIPTHAGVPA